MLSEPFPHFFSNPFKLWYFWQTHSVQTQDRNKCWSECQEAWEASSSLLMDVWVWTRNNVHPSGLHIVCWDTGKAVQKSHRLFDTCVKMTLATEFVLLWQHSAGGSVNWAGLQGRGRGPVCQPQSFGMMSGGQRKTAVGMGDTSASGEHQGSLKFFV